MKLTAMTTAAIHIIQTLRQEHTTQSLADCMSLPKCWIAKIASHLSRAKLIHSTRGCKGWIGPNINREITLYDVAEATQDTSLKPPAPCSCQACKDLTLIHVMYIAELKWRVVQYAA